MKTPCNDNREGCPYADTRGGCYKDTDHIVPQRLARKLGATTVTRTYIKNHPENKQQLCRYAHDEKTLDGDNPLPTQEYMRDAIIDAYQNGSMHLSETAIRRLGLKGINAQNGVEDEIAS